MFDLPTLADITPADRPRVGGKALHLARLAQAELPVPPGFVVTTALFESALADAGLIEQARAVEEHGDPVAAAALAKAIRAIVLPAPLIATLRDRARGLGERVAVRSSGIDEDGRKRSYAGQHETRLGVTCDDVADAIRSCWASAYEPRVLAYRGGRGPQVGSMAVLVQRMLDARVSGVLFTINPHNGSWREMLLEAVWGLGEGLVSGQIAPHWWVVRRPRSLPGPIGRLLSRVRLSVVQQDRPAITERFVPFAGGVHKEPLPSGLLGRATLDHDAALKICRLGLKVERLFREPQDVEWSLDAAGGIVLLQARPITFAGPPRARDDVLWTRRFIGERWPEPATPLGWSLLSPIFEYFIAYPDTSLRHLGGAPALKLVHSRPYLNATVFRHLLFKLPGTPAPGFMLELVPPEEETAWSRRFAALPGFAVYASIFRETYREQRWKRFKFNPLTNPRRWEQYRERLETELPGLSRPTMSERDAIALVDAQLEFVRQYVGVHVTSLLFANLTYQLLEGALATRVPEDAQRLLEALATCPPGNLTLETNEALWALAQTASDADLEALAAGTPPSDRFAADLQVFLGKYGHRSSASWEIFAPRWEAHPELLLPLLRIHRAPGAEQPLQRSRRQQEAYEAARAELVGKLSFGLDRVFLLQLLDYTRTYLLLRENQRFWFDRLLRAVQRTLLDLGRRLTERGVIDEAADVAYLTWDEVRGLSDGSFPVEDVRPLVARRHAQRDLDGEASPPVFLRGDEGVPEPTGGARLQGLGISPGRARGRVRVLRSPAEGNRLAQGDILVTHAVDPGWTPLFMNAGGIILEMGGRLSHGAVVAREYGIPAVVNLEGVARRLVDGQEVTVDGTRGIVWVH